ncbi:MAG: dipeptide ABC transporter ATP-binding protein [Acidimicrobiales bacterium]
MSLRRATPEPGATIETGAGEPGRPSPAAPGREAAGFASVRATASATVPATAPTAATAVAGVSAVAAVVDLHVSLHSPDGLVHALRGVSLDIAPGEVVALVGESGSGKSVLGATLLGLLPAAARPETSGQVLVDGVDMLNGTARQRRRVLRQVVGAVFQDPLTSLNPTMRVGRQLTEKGSTVSSATRRLREIGVPEPERRLKQFPHELSGGLRQRAMIALAVSAEPPSGHTDEPGTGVDGTPKLIIADEPTTALDVSVQAQIVLLLNRLRNQHGCAVLLVTHDLGVAASIADRIAVLYAGRLCEIGSAADVLQRPRHPYTRALLDARLSIDGQRPAQDPLPGNPPDPRVPSAGCAFEARCGSAQPSCADALPQLADGVACFFPLPAGEQRDHLAVASALPTVKPVPNGHTQPDGMVTRPTPALSIRVRDRAGPFPTVEPSEGPTAEPALILDRVSKSFRLRRDRWSTPPAKLKAVEEVSLVVPAGGAVALVGESGCGKTTTLRMATGLLKPDSGAVQWATGAARPQLVFQDAGSSLTPWMSVLDQVVERLRFAGVERSERVDAAMALLGRVGLDGRAAGAKPRALSGGQRQRAVIARALASGPSLLVCDEPVSALDASLAARVLALLEELRAELGVALLVVTHDLAAARRLGDEVAVMYLGRIVEHADADTLFDQPAHPYTQGLLAAVPTTEPGRLAPTLTGEPPSPLNAPKGCAFRSRCPLPTTDRCEVEVPILKRAGMANVACHLLRDTPG